MVKLTSMSKMLMNHDTQKLHGLGHFMTELIKYAATTICFINKYHALKGNVLEWLSSLYLK